MQNVTFKLSVFLVILFVGLQFIAPCFSYALLEKEQSAYYTIQIGTYISENAADRIYRKLAEKLSTDQLQHLRIEKIKAYYVVRIGRFSNKEEADRFSPTVSSKLSDAPLVTKTSVGPEVVLKEYRLQTAPKEVSIKKQHPGMAAAPQRVKEVTAGDKVAVLPPAQKKNEPEIRPADHKKNQAAASPLSARKRAVPAKVSTKTLKVHKKCFAKPVLVLADVSGSMLDAIKGTAGRTGAEQEFDASGTEEIESVADSVTKVALQKEILLEIGKQMAGSKCDLGIYQFRFSPGKQLLYEPLLRIDSYGSMQAYDTIKNYFRTDYKVYNRRSPITDVLQQLDTNIFWKLSGKISVLLISDGMMTNNGHHVSFEHQEQRKKTEWSLLQSEVKRLKKKYGDSITIHTIYIESWVDQDPTSHDAAEILFKRLADLGEGKKYSGLTLRDDQRVLNELFAGLCCAGSK